MTATRPTRALTVVAPGPMSTVQDLGRPGLGHLGVGMSGAADRRSSRLANRLVGNDESAAVVEMTLGGLTARFHCASTVALTGAPCDVRISGRDGAMNEPITVRAGDELIVATPSVGLRTYLAVRGGIDVPTVLHSRATDTLAGIGPSRIAAGSVLPIGEPVGWLPGVDVAPQPSYPSEPVLTVVPGPRDDWFTAGARQTVYRAAWLVTSDADRVGVRLAGPALDRSRHTELPPEPMVCGALQVPPSGQPILFLADHPITGGYPVIGVVADADLHLAGQLRPGQTMRFRSAQP